MNAAWPIYYIHISVHDARAGGVGEGIINYSQ